MCFLSGSSPFHSFFLLLCSDTFSNTLWLESIPTLLYDSVHSVSLNIKSDLIIKIFQINVCSSKKLNVT